MAEWIIEQPEQQETFGQQAKRVTGSAALKGLQGLEAIADLFGGTPFPKSSEIIKERLGLTPEYLEPRGAVERGIQRFSEFGPAALLGGGIPALGRTAAGSALASLLGEAGVPELVQDIAQIGGEIGAGKLAAKVPQLQRFAQELPSISSARKSAYNLAREAVPATAQVNAQPLIKSFDEVSNLLSTETSKKTAKEITHTLDKIADNIVKNKINPKTAMDLRKSLYRQSRSLPADVSVNYIQPLTKGINEFFASYAAQNPTFYNHLSTADKLTELKHMNLYFKDWLDKSSNLQNIPVAGPLAQSILGNIIGESERFIRSIHKNPAARDYYFNIINSISQNNPTLVANNLNALAKELSPIEAQKPEEETEWIIE